MAHKEMVDEEIFFNSLDDVYFYRSKYTAFVASFCSYIFNGAIDLRFKDRRIIGISSSDSIDGEKYDSERATQWLR